PSASATRTSLGDVLDRWASLAGSSVARESSPRHRLRTRAAAGRYARNRESLREEAEVLQQAWRDDRAAEAQTGFLARSGAMLEGFPAPASSSAPMHGRAPGLEPAAAEPADAPASLDAGPEYLGCLPG